MKLTTMTGLILAIEIIKATNKLYAAYPNEFGKIQKSNLTALLTLGDDAQKFLKPVIAEIQLQRPATVKNSLNKLRALGEAFTALKLSALPGHNSAWQQLVLDVHRFVMTRSDRKSSLQTRQGADWQGIRRFFQILLDEGIAPIGLYLPPVREVLSSIDISRYRPNLIGQTTATSVLGTDTNEKLLMRISLARTDSEYLDEVRDTLASRRKILLDVLSNYWKTLKTNLEFGRDLVSQVNWIDLERKLRVIRKRERSLIHPANPSSSRIGLANYLAVIKNVYGGSPPSDDTLRAMSREIEYLPRLSTLGPVSAWAQAVDAPPNFTVTDPRTSRSLIWWWAGRISHFDVSIIAALLTMLQPSWTPQSVLFAKVTSRGGKDYLDVSDSGSVFEVSKPRANSMKDERLHPLTNEIISTIIAANAELRTELKAQNNRIADLLLLPYGKTLKATAPIFAGANSFLSGTNSHHTGPNWIGALYPELCNSGLGIGTINFSKIRKTEGVLEWFRTKSLKAVSRKLGNSERVVLHHYIPKPLLDAWNTRMVRRYQNLWISVAAANTEFHLNVTDFKNIEELHTFLIDMLKIHPVGTSPLANVLHEKFDPNTSEQTQLKSSNLLHVAISEGSLTALYLYQAHILNLGLTDAVLNKQDLAAGLSPKSFLQLADLLQLRLPNDKNPRFKTANEAAITVAAKHKIQTGWKLQIP